MTAPTKLIRIIIILNTFIIYIAHSPKLPKCALHTSVKKEILKPIIHTFVQKV